ncbi:Nucleotidyltransferase [Pholiota conissans]|uniref:DNA polymerase n=1 Tax=Pholiota conissans TaxID=109636 RepID=A0A9P5Z8C9_9AGAR|nr:Nucleotidyltransferase [Pholiota conissans]
MLSRIFQSNRCYASSSSVFARQLYSTSASASEKLPARSHPNQAIVDLLVKSLEEEELKSDVNPFRLNAFSKAIDSILAVDFPIRSGNDVYAVPGIGPGIVKRINEHLLRRYADNAEMDLDSDSYDQMMKSQAATALEAVPSIGRKSALKLVEAGCLSRDDLLSGKYNSLLSPKQLLNVKYATNLQRPILRKDAEEMLAFCQHHSDPKYHFTLVGDYRRGLESFTDMEIMVSHPSFVHVPLPADLPLGFRKSKKEKVPVSKPRKRRKIDEDIPTNTLHSELIPFLQKKGIVCIALSSNLLTWKGIVRLPGTNNQWGTSSERVASIRRVDGQFRRLIFHIVPQRSIGSGLLSLTGNARFENYLRYRARQKGMLLNEHGIWKWTQHQPNLAPDMTESFTAEHAEEYKPTATLKPVEAEETANQGYWSLIKSSSEEDIFQELGLEYLPPTRRNFTHIVKPSKDDFFDYLE